MPRKTRFIDACFCRPTDRTPVWLMRQAGRYQPSYMELRQNVSFFELCETPELAAQVTVTAVEELNADAAIIFSDILVPLQAMGAEVAMTDKGPKLRPVRDKAAVEALAIVDPEETVPYVMDAIRQTAASLGGNVPLIGFAGAPLTLASYLVEGGGSRSFAELKGMLFGAPDVAHNLLDRLATVVSRHLRAQVKAGCEAIQLFDTWAGILTIEDYREFALPYTSRILDELKDLGVPRILFASGTGNLLEALKESRPDVISVDWNTDLAWVRERVGANIAVQGNLDPCCLFMEEPALEARIKRVLERAGTAPGHVFNLGHGVLPTTKPARARFLVDTVHRLSAR